MTLASPESLRAGNTPRGQGPDLWPLLTSQLSPTSIFGVNFLPLSPTPARSAQPKDPSSSFLMATSGGLSDAGTLRKDFADLSADPKWRGLVPVPAAAAHVQPGPGGVSQPLSRRWRRPRHGTEPVFWKSMLTSGWELTAGRENWAGTVGGAGYLPCQLTDVVTSLSLARCLVTERVRPRSANQSVAPWEVALQLPNPRKEISSGRRAVPEETGPDYKGTESRSGTANGYEDSLTDGYRSQ